MKEIGIIGAGASGLYAAVNLKNENNQVTILEKNSEIGKKILMTGNGRCNITNAKFYDDFLENIPSNQKFIYSAFALHDNYSTMTFFEDNGLDLISEENDRVFPKSQSSRDVVKFFEKLIVDKNIKLITDANVVSICNDEKFIVKTDKKTYKFDYLIIATGGLSYPNTGSNGDGYKFAKEFGHKVTKTIPTLVPIFFKNDDLKDAKALSFDNIGIRIDTDTASFKDQGPALLTKNFITGPIVLKLSSICANENIKEISLDFIAKDFSEFDKELIENLNNNSKKDISNIINEFIPEALCPIILKRSNIDITKKGSQITKEERHSIIENIINFKLSFEKFGGFNTAVITKGGIHVDEINPKTMESKIVPGLYFIGEVLDIDGLTGGFNLQLAFTTGFAAANAIKERLWHILLLLMVQVDQANRQYQMN